jgi:hypothetical protein
VPAAEGGGSWLDWIWPAGAAGSGAGAAATTGRVLTPENRSLWQPASASEDTAIAASANREIIIVTLRRPNANVSCRFHSGNPIAADYGEFRDDPTI